ncbi:MAG TPA: FliH/SctL family protein [Candidatus Binatia bacterium]|jgi:flagellar biosynthesis/type III secretory pathway protein FliH|nr:FliH/SctL family protein [Candidatus Binatia bacterium]
MPSSDGFQPLADPAKPSPGFRPMGSPTPLAADLVADVTPAPEAPEAVVAERLEDHPAFAAGLEQARGEHAVVIAEMQETLAHGLEALATFRDDLRTRYERELLLVALGVARKVVQQELADHPEIWLTMIRSAVKQAVDRERILIRVPPALATWLLEQAPTLRAALDEVKELQIVDDPSLPPLGCVIESRYGDVDIGVETQLGVAERALVGAEV